MERIGEDASDEENFLRGIWGEGNAMGFVLELLGEEVEVLAGWPPAY